MTSEDIFVFSKIDASCIADPASLRTQAKDAFSRIFLWKIEGNYRLRLPQSSKDDLA